MKKTLLILGLGVILASCGDSGLSFQNNCDCGIIEKKIDNAIGKELKKNFDQASGRITITI